jgi:hypothetical protein
MLNFAEQTGSGAVMLVWSFSLHSQNLRFIIYFFVNTYPVLDQINIQTLVGATVSVSKQTPCCFLDSDGDRILCVHTTAVRYENHSLILGTK